MYYGKTFSLLSVIVRLHRSFGRLQPEIGGMFADNMDLLSLIRWRLTCKTNYEQAVASLRRSLLTMLDPFVPKPVVILDIISLHRSVFGGEFALAFLLHDHSLLPNHLDIYSTDYEFKGLCSSILQATSIQAVITGHQYVDLRPVEALRTLVSRVLLISTSLGTTLRVHCSYTSSATAPLSHALCTALSNFVTKFGFGCSHPLLTLRRRTLLTDQELPHLPFANNEVHDRLMQNGFSFAFSPVAWREFRRDALPVSPGDGSVGGTGDESNGANRTCGKPVRLDGPNCPTTFETLSAPFGGPTCADMGCAGCVALGEITSVDEGTCPCPGCAQYSYGQLGPDRAVSPDDVGPLSAESVSATSHLDHGDSQPLSGPLAHIDLTHLDGASLYPIVGTVDGGGSNTPPSAGPSSVIGPGQYHFAGFDDPFQPIHVPDDDFLPTVFVERPLFMGEFVYDEGVKVVNSEAAVIYANHTFAPDIEGATIPAGFYPEMPIAPRSSSSTPRLPTTILDPISSPSHPVESGTSAYLTGDVTTVSRPSPSASLDGYPESKEVGGRALLESTPLVYGAREASTVAPTVTLHTGIFEESADDVYGGSGSVASDESGATGGTDADIVYPGPELCFRRHHLCPSQGRFFGDPGSFVDFFDPLSGGEEFCAQNSIAPYGPMVIWRLLSTFNCERGCDIYDDAIDAGVPHIPVLIRRNHFIDGPGTD